MTADVFAAAERCLNCDSALTGEYCAHCGQNSKHHVHSTVAMIGELIEDLFHTDHRVWRTMRSLLTRPGLLTMEYLKGRRASYTPPFRLYIVLSLGQNPLPRLPPLLRRALPVLRALPCLLLSHHGREQRARVDAGLVQGRLGRNVAGLLTTAVVFYTPTYLYLAMRRVYGQGSFVTAVKYMLLLGGYVANAFISFAVSAAYTAMVIK